MTSSNGLTPETIRTALAAQDFKPVEVPTVLKIVNRRPRSDAAVLLPLLHKGDGWHVLFIRRTEVNGDMHSGQVALPGGGSEHGDPDLTFTALREAQEELAIKPEDVRVLGRLEDHFAISNRIVRPVVGTVPWPYELVPQENEVARWFTIPVAWLADPANHRTEKRSLPLGIAKFDVIYFEKYDGELLWGLSARIVMDFLETVGLNGK